MPRPCECDKIAAGQPYEAGRDCRRCWLYHNRADYKKHWDAPEAAGKPKAKKRSCRRSELVGDYLAESLSWIVGVKAGSCGSCKLLRDRMNCWGVEGCRKNSGLILEKLQTEAFALGLPLPKLAIAPLLELAIRRAEQAKTDQIPVLT